MPTSQIFSGHPRCLFVALLGALFTATSSFSDQIDLSALRASALFVQAGVGDQRTRAYVAGATWTGPGIDNIPS